MTNPIHSFHFVDYIIFGITIVVSLGIGIYHALSGGKQRTTSEYLIGNRRMAVLPVAISLVVSFESSIMMLGTPAEIYIYGFQWLIGSFGWFCSNMLAIKLMVPLLHPLKITSAYEYLEMRFKSRHIRTVGTVLGMVSYTGYLGIVLFGPAIALEGDALLTMFPLFQGGLKAVIWTDVFQAFVMYAGIFAVLIKGTMVIGGVGRTWEIADQKGRLNMFNFDTDPTVRHTFWNLFVGSFIQGLGLIFNPSSVQRISSTPSQKDARQVLLLTAPVFFATMVLAAVEGIIAYAYYDTLRCDPLASKQIRDPNQIIPYMVMDIFQSMYGMPGLWLASLFSASLSTLSSGLSSLSALFWHDIVKPHVKPMSEKQATIIAKCSVTLFGGISILIAFLISMIGGTLIQITSSVLSAFGGPLTGMFLLGAFFPFANAKGAIAGSLSGVMFTFWIAMGQMMTKGSVKNTKLTPAPVTFCPGMNVSMPGFYDLNATVDAMDNLIFYSTQASHHVGPVLEPEMTGISRLYTVSYQWFGTIGILTTIVVGVIVSLLTGPTKREASDPRYLISFYDEIFCCLPEFIRKIFRCGYNFKREENIKDDEYRTVNEDALNMELVIEEENSKHIAPLSIKNRNNKADTKLRPKRDTLLQDRQITEDNVENESIKKVNYFNKQQGVKLHGPKVFVNSEITLSKIRKETGDLPNQPLLAHVDNSNMMNEYSIETRVGIHVDEIPKSLTDLDVTHEIMQ
ncbi:hypothetical protein ACJMK2_018568 [Sinanodonta woodiana]|uniref:Sodium-coupled monocarboxylate transporter 1 n=1 Tax=Sinanodonta woodiana TaxID=1069815 RepID=A0ABD3UHR2_SINWO